MDLIVNLDFLGTGPSFNVKGRDSFKTLFGSILSILVSGLLVLGAGYFINQLLSKTNYNIIQSEEYSPLGYMDWTNYEFAVTITNKVGEKLENADKIYSVRGMWYLYDAKKNSNKSEVEMETTVKFFNMEYCDLNRHFPNSTDLWKEEKFLSTSFCFPKDYPLNTSQVYTTKGNKGIVLYLARCANTTLKKNCFPSERIEKELENVIVMTRFKNVYFDPKLTEDTGVPYIYTHSPSVSSSVLYKFNYYFNNVDYITDESLFFSTETVRLYNVIGDLKANSDLTKDSIVPGTFVTLMMNMHPMKKNFKKTYYKFQNMVADMGGLMKGILTVAGFINLYFSEKLYYSYIISQNTESLLEQRNNQSQKITNTKNKWFEKYIQNTPTSSARSFKDQISKNENNQEVGVNNFDKNEEDLHNSKVTKFSVDTFNLSRLAVNNKKRNVSGNLENNFKLGYLELVFPSICFSRNSGAKKQLILHEKLSILIKNKFEMSNMFKRFCNIDKLEYIICGEDIISFRKLFNPTFYNDQAIPKDSEVSLFREKILQQLSKNKPVS